MPCQIMSEIDLNSPKSYRGSKFNIGVILRVNMHAQFWLLNLQGVKSSGSHENGHGFYIHLFACQSLWYHDSA